MTNTHKIDKTVVSNLQTDLNEKANTELSNLSSDGKHYVAFKGYDSTSTYSLNEVVMTIISDSIRLYQSLVDNNTYVLSDTTKWKEVELGGGSDIDNSTITLNSNDEIQTVGVIDNRSGSALKLWTGTRSQYDAIQNKDANTLYNITDDTGDLGTFANTDLSNLSNTGEAHFANPALTNSPYTTNRILEIPQDIKLELDNGTLTLKAGSKVYVPNGFEQDGTTPKFDVVTTASDISLDYGAGRKNCFVVVDEANRLQWAPFEQVGSGTSPTTEGIYYNTSANTITSPAGWFSEKTSLPIALITENSGAGIGGGVKSIDQIFNGFGYIGSTVFILPGVKVQIPNGRNEDGTCKNIIWTNDSVKIWTQPNITRTDGMWVSSSGLGCSPLLYYDSENNIIKNSSDNTPRQSCKVADVITTSGKITSFIPCYVDGVANSNASNFSQAGRSYLSGFGIPTHINGRLVSNSATTETDFVAPCNGVFKLNGLTLSAGKGHCQFFNITQYNATSGQIFMQYGGGFNAASSGQFYRAVGAVKKGDVIRIQYSSNIVIGGQGYGEGLFFLPFEGEN